MVYSKVQLSEETRLALIELEKRVLNKYASLKIKIILALNTGKLSQKEIAEFCLLDENTVTKIKQDFLNNNGDFDDWIDTDYTGGNNSKLTKEQETEISRFVEDNMFTSSAIIQDHIFNKYRIFYSISGLVKLLHRLGFSYKKPVLVPDKLDPKSQEDWLEEYYQLEIQAKLNNEIILFGDACHPTHNTIAQGCWQKIGKDNTKEIKAKSGRDRVNILGLYDLHNQDVITNQCESVNAQSIVDICKKTQLKYTDQNIPTVHIILDNAKVHKSNIVNDWLKSEENQEANQRGQPIIKFKFLTTYSPNLNKIEQFWKYMKKHIANKFYPTFKEFKQAIDDFFENLPEHKFALMKFITNKFHLFKGGKVSAS